MRQDDKDYLSEIDNELRYWFLTGKTRREEAEDSSYMLGCALLGFITVSGVLLLFGLAYLARN